MVCGLRVFRATEGDEQTVLFTMSGFVDCSITGFLDDGGEVVEPIDFLCVQ